MSDTDRCDWWFGEDGLFFSSVDGRAQWKEHPFDALESGEGLTLYRRDGEGDIDHRDAAIALEAFACRQAFQLTHLWDASAVVLEYLQTGDERLRRHARVAAEAALEQADLAMRDAALLMEAAEANCPKLGLFARAATRAAARAAAINYVQATAAYHHRCAALHAVAATLLATARGTCEDARLTADQAVNAAGFVAAAEGVITAINGRPVLLPPGVAHGNGLLAATVNARALFSAMVNELFVPVDFLDARELDR
jgi:hypothetical protein